MPRKPMTHQRELLLLAHLRQNGRMPLKELSRKTGIPITTIFDTLVEHHQQRLITKHTLIFDFQKIHYPTRATILLRVEKNERESIATFLIKHSNVNTLYRITNGYDFIIDCVFQNIQQLEQFTENIETKFNIKAKETHYVLDDLKREGFLSDPTLLQPPETPNQSF